MLRCCFGINQVKAGPSWVDYGDDDVVAEQAS
jgi:hypothetical protein